MAGSSSLSVFFLTLLLLSASDATEKDEETLGTAMVTETADAASLAVRRRRQRNRSSCYDTWKDSQNADGYALCDLTCRCYREFVLPGGKPPDHDTRTVTLRNRYGSETCSNLASQRLNDWELLEKYGMNCMEMQEHCCLCNTHESEPFLNNYSEMCSYRTCPARYTFKPFNKHPRLSSREYQWGTTERCQETLDLLEAVSCHEPCDFINEWTSVILLDHCCEAEEDPTLQTVLVVWLCGSILFGILLFSAYLCILCSEPWYKKAQRQKRTIDLKGRREATSYLLTQVHNNVGHNLNIESSNSRSQEITWGHCCRSCGIRFAASWVLLIIASTLGGLAGAVFMVDVVRIRWDDGILVGATLGCQCMVIFLVAKTMRELQIWWSRTVHERRERLGTCSSRLMALSDLFGQFCMLVLAFGAMFGCGPLSCFYCVRHIGKEHYESDANYIDNEELRTYCDRFVPGTEWYELTVSFIFVFLIASSVDILIRIGVQTGFCPVKSLRRFFQITLHKCELGTLGIALIMGVIHLSNNDATQGDREGHCRRLAFLNLSILANRVLRCLVYLTGASVERLDEEQKKFENRKVWPSELKDKKDKYINRNIVRWQACMNSYCTQLLFMVLQVGFGVIFVNAAADFIPMEEETRNMHFASRKPLIRLLSAVLCGEMFIELYVRIAAQGSEHFFILFHHQVEGVLLLVIWCCSLYAWFFLGSHKAADEWMSWICLVAMILQRFTRLLGIKYKVSSSGFDAQNIFDSISIAKFEDYCGDIFEVCPQNVHINFDDDDIEISVEKATLKPEAFDGIHLPIVPEYGLIEELTIKMQAVSPSVAGLWNPKEEEPNSVKIKNLLLIGVPGDGLASASISEEKKKKKKKLPDNEDEDRDEYWDPASVRQAKAKLVEMINKRIRAKPQTRQTSDAPAQEEIASSKNFGHTLTEKVKKVKTHMQHAKNRLKDTYARSTKENFLENLTVEISNVVFQFEDTDDVMKCRQPLLNVRIGRIWVERKKDIVVRCDVYRISLRVENGGPDNVSHSWSQTIQACESAKSADHSDKSPAGNNKLQRLVERTVERTENNVRKGKRALERAGSAIYTNIAHMSPITQKTPHTPNNVKLPSTDTTPGMGNDSSTTYSNSQFQDRKRSHQHLDPKMLAHQIARYNESEIVRLWGLEKAAQRDAKKPLYNHHRLHIRNERTADRNVVFSLLHVSFFGGIIGDAEKPAPKPIPTERRAEHKITIAAGAVLQGMADMADKLQGTMDKCLKTEAPADETTSTPTEKKVWQWQTVSKPLRFKLDDEQMRVITTMGSSVKSWTLRDNSLRWRPDLSPSEASPGIERKAVVWFWWMYAYHGALMQSETKTRPNRIGLDLLWRVQNCKLYKQLLRSVALRSRQGPFLRLDRFLPGEESEVEYLQSKLSLPDIIRCRKEILQSVVNLQHEESERTPWAPHKEKSTQFASQTPPMQSEASPPATHQFSPESPPECGRTESKETGSASYGSYGSSGYTSSASAQPEDIFSDLALRSNGDWLFEVASVEMYLLRYKDCPQFGPLADPRDIIIHMRSSQVLLDVRFNTAAKSVPPILPGETLSKPEKLGRLSPHFAVSFSVDAFGVSCLQAGKLVPGSRKHIFTITRPTLFRPASHSDFVAGRRTGKNVSMAWRTAFSLDEVGQLSPLKMEFFLGEMRMIYPTPLKNAVDRFKSKSPSWEAEAGAGTLYTVSPADAANEKSAGFEANYREQFEEFRRRKSHTWYKRFVGVRHHARDYHVDLDMKAINLQMHRYILSNERSIRIETYNFRPYCGSFRRGTTVDAVPKRMMTLEAFFGDRTGKMTWEKEFRQSLWQNNTDAQEDANIGSSEHQPSHVEWVKRIVTTDMVERGQLDAEYARWRAGTSGHHIFPHTKQRKACEIMEDTALGTKLFPTVMFADDDLSCPVSATTTWLALGSEEGGIVPVHRDHSDHAHSHEPAQWAAATAAIKRWFICREAAAMCTRENTADDVHQKDIESR